jgi:DNA-directed RNA polymerase subunit M/transcription elongation factor TFIIS
MPFETVDKKERRQKGIKALGNVLNIKTNITTLEQNIFHFCKNLKEYNNNIYQIIEDIHQGSKLKPLLINIKKNLIGWEHPHFNNVRNRMKEQDEFIETPLEVVEGILECRCGSKRVFSYSKQTRGADEPSSTFAQCVACNAKWVYSG